MLSQDSYIYLLNQQTAARLVKLMLSTWEGMQSFLQISASKKSVLSIAITYIKHVLSLLFQEDM